MARNVVVFDKFAGEYGDREPWDAPPHSFHALNMIVYKSGELGVRAGMKERTPSGVATGVVLGFGNTPVPTRDAWFAIGNTVYTFDMLVGNNLLTATGSMAGAATTVFDSVQVGTDIYLTAKGKTNSYKLQVNSGVGTAVLTTMTGSPSGRTITSLGARMVIGDITGSLENRIRFSDALDYNSWPSANFIDIGDGWLITGLYPQRQHLVISKQVGFYVLTGVPGVNPVLRKVSNDFGPLGSHEGAMGSGDVLYNWPIFGHFPADFNGTRNQKLRHLNTHISTSGTGDVFPPTNGVTPIVDYTDGAIFVEKTTNKAIAYLNNVHTYHTFGQNISGFVSKDPGTGGLVTFCDGGGASSTAKFWIWDVGLDRPGFEGDTHARAGDGSSTPVSGSVTFPEYWDRSADEFYVKAVIVDFRKWNTGGASNNHFDLSVDTLRTYQAGTVASNTVSFDEAVASSSASGTIARRIFGFGEQGVGNGFQLNFTNVKGIAFQRIEVVLDTRPARV